MTERGFSVAGQPVPDSRRGRKSGLRRSIGRRQYQSCHPNLMQTLPSLLNPELALYQIQRPRRNSRFCSRSVAAFLALLFFGGGVTFTTPCLCAYAFSFAAILFSAGVLSESCRGSAGRRLGCWRFRAKVFASRRRYALAGGRAVAHAFMLIFAYISAHFPCVGAILVWCLLQVETSVWSSDRTRRLGGGDLAIAAVAAMLGFRNSAR